jgi:Asp-tRNA(Asn)/Glu-tRNA(Gln) amidotransferase A subunit family amidase
MSSALPRTIAAASHLIETRALSPVELTRALLQRIESLDPVISSWGREESGAGFQGKEQQ